MSGEAKVPYPKGIPLILTTEFCERFSYYGMRAILVLFVHNVINLSETNSSVLFHGFTFVAYATPIFGAILADSFIGNDEKSLNLSVVCLLGKFNTIFYLSLLYAVGQIVIVISSVKWVTEELEML